MKAVESKLFQADSNLTVLVKLEVLELWEWPNQQVIELQQVHQKSGLTSVAMALLIQEDVEYY